MAYFDLVAMPESAVEGAAKRLGFRRIFCLGSDAELLEDASQRQGGTRKVIVGGSADALAKGLRRNDVVAALVGSRSLSGKELEMLRDSGKPLLIPIARIACAQEAERHGMLRGSKGMVREAMMHRVRMALASLAESPECVMSAQQMLGVGRLLGMSDRIAEQALGALGEAL